MPTVVTVRIDTLVPTGYRLFRVCRSRLGIHAQGT
jgi:hypothetical protein